MVAIERSPISYGNLLIHPGGWGLPHVAYMGTCRRTKHGFLSLYLNRVYKFGRVCPKHDLHLSKTGSGCSLNIVCPKQVPKIERDVKHRVVIIGLSRIFRGPHIQCKHWSGNPPPPPKLGDPYEKFYSIARSLNRCVVLLYMSHTISSPFIGIFDEIDNPTIAVDETTILEIKVTIRKYFPKSWFNIKILLGNSSRYK